MNFIYTIMFYEIYTYRVDSYYLCYLCSIKSLQFTELVNPEPLLLEKYRVRFLQASDYNILFTHPCVTLFYVCFCLKAPYLIYVADSLTWNSQPRALRLVPGQSSSNIHHSLLVLGTLDSTLALCLGPS